MAYNPDIHHRRSIRLKGYDYSQQGLYFITVCVKHQACLFGNIEGKEMRLNLCGEIVQVVWDELPKHYNNIKLDAFIVMPNHIHGIIEIMRRPPADDDDDAVGAGLKPAPTSLFEIVRALKTFSARKINKHRNCVGTPIWQRNYYEHIIRNKQSYQNIAEYIKHNPERWETDMFFKEDTSK